MEIVETQKVSFAKASRSGYASMLGKHLKGMKPGQSLLVSVDYSEIQALDEEGLQAFAAAHKITSKPGEGIASAISRWIASRQRTRIMASLNLGELPAYYYHTKLVSPNTEGLIEKIAIVCDPLEVKPARSPRKKKVK